MDDFGENDDDMKTINIEEKKMTEKIDQAIVHLKDYKSGLQREIDELKKKQEGVQENIKSVATEVERLESLLGKANEVEFKNINEETAALHKGQNGQVTEIIEIKSTIFSHFLETIKDYTEKID